MELIPILAFVIALYARSIRYKYMSDDRVLREEYLYNVPEVLPPPDFTRRIPPIRVRIWTIANHCINVVWVWQLFGWKAALLFGVHPVAVSQVCWLTGNYYAGTTTLVMAAYWCLQQFGWFGAIGAAAFYTAAINSTLTALGVPLFYLMTLQLPGILLFLPMIKFITGDRFTKGMKIRHRMRHRDFDKVEPKKIFFMTKIVYEYLIMFFAPGRMALFRTFGEGVSRTKKQYDRDCSPNLHFWMAALACGALLLGGLLVNPVALWWFCCNIAPHTQFKVYGQSNPCDRYLYMPMIGLCILVAQVVPDPVLFMFAGFLAYRSHLYIYDWKDTGSLHLGNLRNSPERAMSHSDYGQWVMSHAVGVERDMVRINEASYHIQKALAISEKGDPIFETYVNMAYFLANMGNVQAALEMTKKAISVGGEQGCNTMLEDTLVKQVTYFEGLIRQHQQTQQKAQQAKEVVCSGSPA